MHKKNRKSSPKQGIVKTYFIFLGDNTEYKKRLGMFL